MPYLVKGVRNIMGTLVTIGVVCPEKDEAREALSAGFDEIKKINDLMSAHKENSEVSILNREGHYRRLSTDTGYVIQRSHHFSELSDGIFDITVLPVLKLWEERARSGNVPPDTEINERLKLVNYRNIIMEYDNIRFREAGMGITLAGVAKGYAVDRAIETLKERHIKQAIVNAGGDIRVMGGKSETTPWKIGLRDPINNGMAAELELYERAIATSGTYQRPFQDIIDPRAGRPARGILSATAMAETAIDADILATSIYILGAERGTELLKKLDGVEALVIKSDGSLLKLGSEHRN
jgi:thiamine biosynthesis lipoprotein